ncbi:MAG: hypothetical protein SF339_06620 [Blastocatellia bacterium]|nr:hypothetical protein [Blastocatellia bacterium]
MKNTIVDQSSEEYEYDCGLLKGKTNILITKTIEVVDAPSQPAHIELGRAFNCKNVTLCGIAAPTLHSDQWDVDWEACPGLRDFKQSGRI